MDSIPAFIPEGAARKGRALQGPNCFIKMADLGIALRSEAKTAATHNIDRRIIRTAGVAALSIWWVEDCNAAYGIPIKTSGKSIYFDRAG